MDLPTDSLIITRLLNKKMIYETKKIKKLTPKYLRKILLSRQPNSTEAESKPDKTKISNIEKRWLNKVLEHKFMEEASVLCHDVPRKRTFVYLSKNETLECSMYKTFLQKELLCKNYLDNEDVDLVCGHEDFNCTLAKVTHLFIQPPINHNSMIVISPNLSTLRGMDMILSMEKRLQRTANVVDHSRPYIRYVTGYSRDLPKCVACCNSSYAHPLESTYEQAVKYLKSSMLVVDEVMKREAMLETRASSDQELHCKCSVLKKSKADVVLLSKRFLSMFLWPFLLASAGVSVAQEELLFQKQEPMELFKKDPDHSKKSKKTYKKQRKPKANYLGNLTGIKLWDATGSTNAAGKKRAYVKNAVPIKQEIESESLAVPIKQENGFESLAVPIQKENKCEFLAVPIKQENKWESSNTPIRRSSRSKSFTECEPLNTAIQRSSRGSLQNKNSFITESECEYVSSSTAIRRSSCACVPKQKSFTVTECEFASSSTAIRRSSRACVPKKKPFSESECEYGSPSTAIRGSSHACVPKTKPFTESVCEYGSSTAIRRSSYACVSKKKPFTESECEFASSSTAIRRSSRACVPKKKPFSESECEYGSPSTAIRGSSHACVPKTKSSTESECEYASSTTAIRRSSRAWV